MLWTICMVLFILWLLGLFGGFALGGGIHLLWVVIIIVLIFALVRRA